MENSLGGKEAVIDMNNIQRENTENKLNHVSIISHMKQTQEATQLTKKNLRKNSGISELPTLRYQ